MAAYVPYVANAIQVAALLARSIATTVEEQTNLSRAEQFVRGLAFDQFEESSACQVLTGIQLSDFQSVVADIGNLHSLQQDQQRRILLGQYSDVNEAVYNEFFFNVGETGSLVFFKATTVKTSHSTIDLALVSYRLKFRLSPDRIETRRRRWLFGFIPFGSVTSVDYNPRNLSEIDQSGFAMFFRNCALQRFLREYPEARAALPQLQN